MARTILGDKTFLGNVSFAGNIDNKDLTQAFQTIRKALEDGYADITGTPADGYVTFFTGDTQIAGDNDLKWDRANNKLLTNRIDLHQICFVPNGSNPPWEEGLVFYDDAEKALSLYNNESEVTHQLGQEQLVRAKNTSGLDIEDGKVVYVTGAAGNRPTISLAQASTDTTSSVIGVTTHTITNNNNGFVTIDGIVNDIPLPTATFGDGDIVYLSTSSPGELTTIKPDCNGIVVEIGIILLAHNTAGKLLVHVKAHSDFNDLHGINVDNAANGNILLYDETVNSWGAVDANLDGYALIAIENQRWIDSSQQLQDLRVASDGYQQRLDIVNNSIIETVDINVTSNGSIVTFSVEAEGGGDLTVLQDDGKSFVFDTTPPASISLTTGIDTSPILNYVYISVPEGTLSISTDNWPLSGYSPLATVLVQSASGVQTDGVYKMHAWVNHIKDGYRGGHIADVNFWIRQQQATWISGASTTITGGVGTFDVAATSAQILQLHPHTYPALDTGAGDSIFIINDSSTPYKKVADLTGELTDSVGSSMSGKAFYMVIWGAVSEKLTDSKLICNLPTGSYNSSILAADDPNGTSVFSIPTDFTGTGFLIARILVSHSVAAGGTWTINSVEDLRGLFPSQSAGTSVPSVTSFTDDQFQIVDDGDGTKVIEFQASGITTGTTRTITMPDEDITLVGATQGADGYLAFFTGPNQIAGDNDLYYDRVNSRLGVNTSSPSTALEIAGNLRVPQGPVSIATDDLTIQLGADKTGFFSPVANQPSMAANGTVVWEAVSTFWQMAASGAARLTNSAGTTTSPSVIPSNQDSNTGISGSSADQFSIIAGGIEGVRVTESGDAITVDVNGHLNVTGDLDVSGDINNTLLQNTLDGYSTGSGVTANAGADGYIAFFTGSDTIAGDNDLYYDRTNSRLGLNTDSPTERLQVNGNTQIDERLSVGKSINSTTSLDVQAQATDTYIQEWRNSAGTKMADISTTGRMHVETQAGASPFEPGYSFVDDTTVGMYLKSSGVGFAGAGVVMASIDPFGINSANNFTLQGVIYQTSGTVTAPGLAFSTDANTGIYRIAADTLGFTAGGIEAMRITEASSAITIDVSWPIYDAAKELNLGTTASTSHGLATGDVLVGGAFEVDGAAYFDGYTSLIGGGVVQGEFSIDGDVHIGGNVLSAGIVTNIPGDGYVTSQFNGQSWSTIADTITTIGTEENINLNASNSFVIDLEDADGDVTLVFTNPKAGASYVIKIIQSSTTARDIIWPGTVLWTDSVTPVISAGADAVDIVSLFFDGTNFYATIGQNYG